VSEDPPTLSLPSRDEVLGQMAYLVDELDAQSAILDFIPELAWDAQPMPGAPTLRGMYEAMLARECKEYRSALGLDPLPIPESSSPDSLLSSLAACRARTVEEGRDEFGSKQLIYCYQVTQNDTASLREIGVRLSEMNLVKPRIRRL